MKKGLKAYGVVIIVLVFVSVVSFIWLNIQTNDIEKVTATVSRSYVEYGNGKYDITVELRYDGDTYNLNDFKSAKPYTKINDKVEVYYFNDNLYESKGFIKFRTLPGRIFFIAIFCILISIIPFIINYVKIKKMKTK